MGYLSAVGDDEHGRALLTLWQREGIDTEHVSVDPAHATGYYTISKMAEKAIEKAKEFGLAIAFGYNHGDAGSFFTYTSLALEHDMVAMASNNSLPMQAPFGGMDFRMSTPPFDAACPAGDELPIIVQVI